MHTGQQSYDRSPQSRAKRECQQSLRHVIAKLFQQLTCRQVNEASEEDGSGDGHGVLQKLTKKKVLP